MYAIIEDSGTQIKVAPGDVLEIDLRPKVVDQGAVLTFDKVLAVGSDDAAGTIGTPYVSGASVTAEVIEEVRGKKIDVIKFKRRKGYSRKNGHRQRTLRVRIGEISA